MIVQPVVDSGTDGSFYSTSILSQILVSISILLSTKLVFSDQLLQELGQTYLVGCDRINIIFRSVYRTACRDYVQCKSLGSVPNSSKVPTMLME